MVYVEYIRGVPSVYVVYVNCAWYMFDIRGVRSIYVVYRVCMWCMLSIMLCMLIMYSVCEVYEVILCIGGVCGV